MTVKERLIEEFSCAIDAVLGEEAEREFGENAPISSSDLLAIARKVSFYLDIYLDND